MQHKASINAIEIKSAALLSLSKQPKTMKKILLLFTFLSFTSINAQEINLRNLTPEQRKEYVIQEATRALDVYLHDFIKRMIDPNAPVPTYAPHPTGYSEKRYSKEGIDGFNYFYGHIVTDYTVVKNDYVYIVYFSAPPVTSSSPFLYSVSVLNNGKALSLFLEQSEWFRTIYNATE